MLVSMTQLLSIIWETWVTLLYFAITLTDIWLTCYTTVYFIEPDSSWRNLFGLRSCLCSYNSRMGLPDPKIWTCTYVCSGRIRLDCCIFCLVWSYVAFAICSVPNFGHHLSTSLWSFNGTTIGWVFYSRIVWNDCSRIPWWHCNFSSRIFSLPVLLCSWVCFPITFTCCLLTHLLWNLTTNRAAVGPFLGGYLMDHWGYAKASTVLFAIQIAMVCWNKQISSLSLFPIS